MSKERSNRCDRAFNRPANVLKALEKRAINIRTLLQQTEKALDQKASRDMDDALKLAVTIEAVASSSVNLQAADALNSVELLEVLIEVLEQKLNCILTS